MTKKVYYACDGCEITVLDSLPNNWISVYSVNDSSRSHDVLVMDARLDNRSYPVLDVAGGTKYFHNLDCLIKLLKKNLADAKLASKNF